MTIVYADEKYFPSFHQTLGAVARERIYIEMLEAPSLEQVADFQRGLIERNSPVYYALEGERVVGWCDITGKDNPRQAGMGLLPGYRGKGLGSKLMNEALAHAKRSGFEKVELHVYSTNLNAIALYKKFGFEQEGIIRNYRKVDGRYFDAIMMGKIL
jgi:ribosomal protein S18 acetylase RimI-like enzyme